MNVCRAPINENEFAAYYQLRWQILRQPWQQAHGSEKDELEGQSYHRALFDAQHNIIAVGRLHRVDQELGQIRYMAVDEQHQGQGFGQTMIKTLEQIAMRTGVRTLQLNARENAVPFYQQLGYQNQGFSHSLYDEINHFKMVKTLTAAPQHLIKQSDALQQLWHQTIPMSKAMNINICYFDQQKLITNCQLSFNKNLHNTMFAGSIYTLATLTGWGWLYLSLQAKGLSGDIVLADGQIKYLAPLAGAGYAKTSLTQTSGSIEVLSAGKNAKVTIEVEVCCGDNVAAIFKGLYVALAKR